MAATTKTSAMVAGALMVACWIGFTPAVANGQIGEGAVLLVIDRYAIDYGLESYQVPPDVKNDLIAAVGVRDPLPFFSVNIGREFVLRTGTEGNDSWFALNSAPLRWQSESGANDSLQNFVLAGPGLGSPDRSGDRESLLGGVSGLTPVRAGIAPLIVGRNVCAVIYDDDLSIVEGSTEMDLHGANLGLMAFRVSSLVGTATQWPGMRVELLDVRETCSGKLETYPQPTIQ
jgi:hypothetical protein